AIIIGSKQYKKLTTHRLHRSYFTNLCIKSGGCLRVDAISVANRFRKPLVYIDLYRKIISSYFVFYLLCLVAKLSFSQSIEQACAYLVALSL
uniref:hypothetical protein n=1 Tax=Vibrio anguillarum TaxID=55601 RepID=UPI001BE4B4F9